jgi:hypothetical protein
MVARKLFQTSPIARPSPPLPPHAMNANDIEQLFSTFAFEATVSLFDAYDVKLEPTTLENYRKNPQLDLISIGRFVGPSISGCIILGATREPVENADPHAVSARDWIGELANQLLGRIKNKALRQGIQFSIVPPAVVSGRHLTPVTSRDEFRPFVFTSAHGTVCIWSEIETTRDIEIDHALADSDIPHEGDLILF